jgi:hypothetical protein
MRKLGWAALITLAQILFALSWAPKGSNCYLRLLNWDSDHYRSIALNGYRIPDHPITSDDIHSGRANVVFLPGYPLTSRAVQKTLDIPIDYALLAVSQLSAMLFWFYFFAFLELAGIGEKSRILGAFALVVHPAAFYMIAGYTESLFLAAMMGFFYWIERAKIGGGIFSRLLALTYGLLLCWTRIVGVAVAFYPVVRNWRNHVFGVGLFVLSVMSLIGFFIFCQVHFSDWAIYFHLEETGWQNHRLYFALFNPLTYLPPVFFEDTIQSLNKASVTFTMFLLVVIVMAEWKISQIKFRLRDLIDFFSSLRGGLFLISFGMFYVALTGKANSNLDSMLRYTFPSYVLLVIEIILLNHARRELGEGPLFFAGAQVGNRRARLKLGSAVIFGIGFQAWCVYRFTHGHWVA